MYAIAHKGRAIGPCGVIKDVNGTPLDVKDVESFNREVGEQEIAWLKTHPKHIFLYVKMPDKPDPRHEYYSQAGLDTPRVAITTGLGVTVSQTLRVGKRKYVGFGGAYRRSIGCTIFGRAYYGWYMESSGDYCRLRLGTASPQP